MLEKYQNGKTAETTTSKLFDFAGTNVYDLKRFKISRVSNFTILTLIYFFASIELCKEKKNQTFHELDNDYILSWTASQWKKAASFDKGPASTLKNSKFFRHR